MVQKFMLPSITHNAGRMKELHARVHETVKMRDKSPEDRAAWEEACRVFHDSYDELAFPGGLRAGLEKIKAGDGAAIGIALNYLERTPYCFRSQYVATDLKRALNKVALPERLASRFTAWKMKRRSTA